MMLGRQVKDKRDVADRFELIGDDFAKTQRDVAQLYRKLDPTQEWAENNYYHVPIEQQTADLVPRQRVLARLRRGTTGDSRSSRRTSPTPPATSPR